MATTLKRIIDDNQDTYFKFIVIFLLFLLLAFDRDLAMIYLLIMLGDYIWHESDNFISFRITNKSAGFSTTQIILESAAALGAFLGISTLLVNTISPDQATQGVVSGAQSIFQLLSTSTPILKGSKFLTLVGWGILVPIIETSFFNGRLLEGLATYSEKITGTKANIKSITGTMILVIFVVAALFTLFHITAKGLDSLPLLITFLFSVISSILVIRHRQLRGAILVHIATNSMAVAASLGWLGAIA
jgi:hypothetical protein